MKTQRLFSACVLAAFLTSQPAADADRTVGMQTGDAALKSIGPLAFGPEGILFVADAKSAAIVAIATEDTKPGSSSAPLKVERIDLKIAGLLGPTADQIQIMDMVVNPISHNVYVAVVRGNGPDAIPVLLKVDAASKLGLVELDNVEFSRS